MFLIINNISESKVEVYDGPGTHKRSPLYVSYTLNFVYNTHLDYVKYIYIYYTIFHLTEIPVCT